MLEYPFRSASHQQMIHRAVAVCAHHNEVRINGVRLIQNFVCYCAGRLVQCDVDASLRDFVLPSRQLRRLISSFCDWLRPRIKGWDRHAPHPRKLGHSSQAVAERARRCGRGEFSNMKEMNLRVERFSQLLCQIDHAWGCVRKINRD